MLTAEDVGRSLILVALPVGATGQKGTTQRVATDAVGLAPSLCRRLRDAAPAGTRFAVSIVRAAVKLPLKASDGPLALELEPKRLRLLAGKRQLWKVTLEPP